jgi:deazaflavin-dependent oxidoreductase (nitroreductase family)
MMPGMGKGIYGHITSRVPAPKPGTCLWGPLQRLTALNTKLYRVSGGRLFGRYDQAPLVILHHRGAKTGEPRETPLVHMIDGDDVIIVASIGGNPKNPAWLHNLRAHPDVPVEIRGTRRPMIARVVDEDERAALWPRLLEVWPAWEDYQARTTRQIPVVRLTSASPA